MALPPLVPMLSTLCVQGGVGWGGGGWWLVAGAQGLHGRLPKWVGAGPGRGLHAAAVGDGQVRRLAVKWRSIKYSYYDG